MEGVNHRMMNVNGIKMHLAEKGEGPVVLLIHGFPEFWYSWRHQIQALSSLGYHAVAPDLRGYGDTEAPASVSSYSCLHIVGDLIALIDLLGVEQVYLVAQDWGATISWYLCLFRPERVKAFVCLSVPFTPRIPNIKPVDGMRNAFGDEYYVCRCQEPRVIEAEIAQAGGPKEVLKRILTLREPGPLYFPKGNAFKIDPANPITLPGWLPDEDLTLCAKKFDQTGSTGALNYYRAIDLNWELTAAWTGAQVKVPVKFIVGEVDVVYTTPGFKEYIHSELGFKKDVPLLEEIVVLKDAGHFINQERAKEINDHIHDFIKKF